MKREIKFRGKSHENNMWVYGGLVTTNLGGGRAWITSFEYLHGDNNQYVRVASIEVYPETVGQYTELVDTNGREIYDGDVLGWVVIGGNFIREESVVVQHNVKSFLEHTADGSGTKLSSGYNITIYSSHGGAVIGNIHDNPELLK